MARAERALVACASAGGQAMSLHTIAAVVVVASYVALWVITLWMAQK
jgi:hypothetical protein